MLDARDSPTSCSFQFSPARVFFPHFSHPSCAMHTYPSSSSELGNALVEIHSSEPQQMGRTCNALPSPPLPSQTAPKHDSCEGAVGLNSIKTEYVTTTSGQPLSPMTSPEGPGPSLSMTHMIKEEEDREQLSVGNSLMPRCSSPPHGHGSQPHRPHALSSFHLVHDPTTSRGFAPSTKRSVQPQPVTACYFCRERKIVCGGPPAGSVDATCKYVLHPIDA